MLGYIPKIVIATLGLGASAYLVHQAILVPPPSSVGLETHVEQFGAMLLAGVALGLAVPVAARRFFVPSVLAIGGALMLLEMFVPETEGWIARLLLDWFGVSAGLVIIKGLFRSWSAMYDKHLVAWGGAPEAADGAEDDYDLPPAR